MYDHLVCASIQRKQRVKDRHSNHSISHCHDEEEEVDEEDEEDEEDEGKEEDEEERTRVEIMGKHNSPKNQLTHNAKAETYNSFASFSVPFLCFTRLFARTHAHMHAQKRHEK